ncbi:MAG TPA: hypothetical protein VMA55_20420 [Acidovorax sp.]|nr:hypothetical protein [Acidovorax sp.]
MVWDKSSRAEKAVVIWALALVTVALLVVLVALGNAVSDNSSNVASWVQAVGSIAAIAAGFGVAEKTLKAQHEQQLARDTEARRQSERMQYSVIADRLNATAAWAETALDQLVESGANFNWTTFERSARTVVESLRAIAADQIPSVEVIHRVHLATVGVESVARGMEIARTCEAKEREDAVAKVRNRMTSVAAMARVDRDFCTKAADKLSTGQEIARKDEARESRKAAIREALRKYE